MARLRRDDGRLRVTVNGIIEIHRRIAHGFRNPTNYRLRMILVGGGLSHPNIR